MDLVEQIEHNCASDFLAYLRKSGEHWWDNGNCTWVFRGHFNADWHLRPSAFREHTKLPQLVEQLERFAQSSDYGFESKQEWQAFLTANAECEALYQFAVLANELHLGHHDPPPSPLKRKRLIPLHQPDSTLLDAYPPAFFRGTGPDICCPPLKVAPLAQHHQIPTRLLDFSSDPMAAAYFAVDPMLRPEEPTPKAIAVWALNMHVERTRFEPNCTIQLIDYATGFPADEYVRAQKGCFVRIRNAVPHYNKYGEWPALDLMEPLPDYPLTTPLLRKVTLPSSRSDELLELLRREGWTHAHMMPTLDNVARTVMSRWKL